MISAPLFCAMRWHAPRYASVHLPLTPDTNACLFERYAFDDFAPYSSERRYSSIILILRAAMIAYAAARAMSRAAARR